MANSRMVDSLRHEGLERNGQRGKEESKRTLIGRISMSLYIFRDLA